MIMRSAISITLSSDNALWLKAQATASAKGTVSAVLDQLVTDARLHGRSEPASTRSVVGTIDIPAADQGLDQADAYLRTMFDRSLQRPMLVKERPDRPASKRRRRG
jgi:hypothetical protein